jgi:hypothetical protein
MVAAGCGGTRACTTERPVAIGSPALMIEVPVRLATVNTIGTSSTKPTSQNTGSPTISATVIIAQCTRFSPKTLISVRAMRVAPPDSAIILPRIVPSATTSEM